MIPILLLLFTLNRRLFLFLPQYFELPQSHLLIKENSNRSIYDNIANTPVFDCVLGYNGSKKLELNAKNQLSISNVELKL